MPHAFVRASIRGGGRNDEEPRRRGIVPRAAGVPGSAGQPQRLPPLPAPVQRLATPTTGRSSPSTGSIRSEAGSAIRGSSAATYPLAGPGRDQTAAYSFHNGVDIGAEPGTPVYPVVSGRVVRANTGQIVVLTDDGRSFQYYHLTKAAPSAKAGASSHTTRSWAGFARDTSMSTWPRSTTTSCTTRSTGATSSPTATGRDRRLPASTSTTARCRTSSPAAPSGPGDRLSVAAADQPAMPVSGPVVRPSSNSRSGRVAAVPRGTRTAWQVAADFRHAQPPPRALLEHLRRRHLPELPSVRAAHLRRPARPLPVPHPPPSGPPAARRLSSGGAGLRRPREPVDCLVAAPDRPLAAQHLLGRCRRLHVGQPRHAERLQEAEQRGRGRGRGEAGGGRRGERGGRRRDAQQMRWERSGEMKAMEEREKGWAKVAIEG